MRAAKGGAVGRVGGREGGTVLKGGEAYASAGRHSNGDILYHSDRSHTELSRNECFVRYLRPY